MPSYQYRSPHHKDIYNGKSNPGEYGLYIETAPCPQLLVRREFGCGRFFGGQICGISISNIVTNFAMHRWNTNKIQPKFIRLEQCQMRENFQPDIECIFTRCISFVPPIRCVTVRWHYNTVNFLLILMGFTHEGEVCGVFCEFKLWFIMIRRHFAGHHWFTLWHGAEEALSHNLNLW